MGKRAMRWLYVGLAYRRAANPARAQAANRQALTLAQEELKLDFRL